MPNKLFTVLLADDEYWVRESLRATLAWSTYGMDFLPPVANGEEALERLSKEPIDILITDINMPYMSGLELIAKVKAVSPRTVILVLSGYSDYEYVRQALVEGALDYLLKPIAKTKLLEVLNRAIEELLKRQQEQQQMRQMQLHLAEAASMTLDRDFSELLHAARHQNLAQTVEAQLFEYEQQFSGYRLTLVKLTDRMEESGFAIKQRMETLVTLKPCLIVRNLYHSTHYLLIATADRAPLQENLQKLVDGLTQAIGAPVQAMVSDAYLSFGDLRKAYDETRMALLSLPIRCGSLAAFACDRQQAPVVQRLGMPLQRQMEQALKVQQRDWLERLIGQSGLLKAVENGWTQLELMHSLNAIAWMLRRSVEERGDVTQLILMDALMEQLSGITPEPTQIESLLMQMEDEAFAAAAPAPSASILDTVEKTKQYVDAHYTEDLSLGALASRFAMDDAYLSRCFKQVAGCNLTLYVMHLRVAEAKRLLAEKGLSITEVAQAVGYDDYSYFSRVFKKLVGKSPRAYQEEEKP